MKTAGAIGAVVLAVLASPGAQAAKTSRGGSCAHPWKVSYSRGRVSGDTSRVSLRVSSKGRQISITWHAQRGYRFCAIVLTEGRGQVFRSTNPSATYRYTDSTADHSNGIRTLTATARSGR